MKIVLLSYYSGLVDRGAETFADAIATYLAKEHKVWVFQAGEHVENKKYNQVTIPASYKNMIVNPTGLTRKFFLDYYSRKIGIFTLKALKKIREMQPDIIMPVNGGWQTVLTKLFCRHYHIKMVTSSQAGIGWDETWNLFFEPDMYIAVNSQLARWAEELSPEQLIEVIPNGVSTAVFKPRNYGFPLDMPHPRVLCVAGPEKYKRVECTIKAVAQLPGASLLIAGGSNETQALGEQLLGKRYKQMLIPHKDMPSVYAWCDVFTLVSESTEAFGIAYLEALSANVPVVATDDLLRHDIAGPAGVYVAHPEDPEEYKQKLQDALYRKWNDLPRKQAKKYDWDIIASHYEKSFEKLLGSV